MARAIGVRASLRHLHFSSSQNVFPRRESNPASTFCSFSSFVANCRTQHCARWNPHELVARKLTHTSCQRQGILLLGRELWGDCQGLGSSRRLGGASAFAEGLRWGGGIAKGDRRGFRTSPIMMGRRAAKIATRKGAQDKKKAKVYGRIGKQIISAVKAGGTDPNANVQLAAVLQAARQSNVPKDIIDRNIKKASDKDQAEYVQQTYEVYGAGGVGIVVEAFTDNLNRAAADIRDAVKKAGGKMADPGSVLFNFERKGIISVYADELEPDDLMMAAMDAGADDVKLPEKTEDNEEEEGSRRFKVISEMDQFAAVKSTLAENSIHIDEEDSGLAMVPLAHIEVDDTAAEVNEAIIERLLDLDDVDSVFSNMAT